MILIKKLLQERASDILYHITTIRKLYSILSGNRFILTPATTEKDYTINKNKFYFLSASRNLKNSYFNNYLIDDEISYRETNILCILVLDGNKLGNKYKSIPVSYFKSRINNEMEDRIILNNPEIPNARSYIKEIHIYGNTAIQTFNKFFKIVYKLRKDIPLYYYNNINAFELLDKRRSIPITNTILNSKTKIFNDMTEPYTINIEYSESSFVNSILNLYFNTITPQNDYFVEDLINLIVKLQNNDKNYNDIIIEVNEYIRHTFIGSLSNTDYNYFISLLKKYRITINKLIRQIIDNVMKYKKYNKFIKY